MTVDVNKVFITKEVAEKLDVNPSYLVRLAKKLLEKDIISENDIRKAGKRNYLFNEVAVDIVKDNLSRK